MSSLCSVCFENGFPVTEFPNDFTLQIYRLREKGSLSGNNEIDPTQLQLCEDCFGIVEIKVLEEKEKRRFLRPRKSDNDNTTCACSTCLQKSDAFPEIVSPHMFTKEIYELRKKGLLLGTHDIDPTQLQLCETCFDVVDDKFMEEYAKRLLQRRANRLLSNASDPVKAEQLTQNGEKKSQPEGTGNGETARPKTPVLIDPASNEGDGESGPVDTAVPGPSPLLRGSPAAEKSAKCEENFTRINKAKKRRTNASISINSESLEDDDIQGEVGEVDPSTNTQRCAQRQSKRGKKATSEGNVDVHPEVNGNTGNEVDEKMGVFLDWAEANGNEVHDSESDEEQEQATNGNGENPRTNGIDSAVPDMRLKPISFIRHAYDLDQDQSSTAEKKKIINMMFDYYNGQIKNYPNDTVTFLTSSWMENTGPGRGFPKPSSLLSLNLTDKSGRGKRGWSDDQLLTTMKLDISQEQELVLVLGFGTEITYEYLSTRKKERRCLEKKGEMLFNIPNNVPLFLTFSSGVVSQLDDLGEAKEMENSEFPLVSGLAIPKIEGMTIKTFEFTEEINLKYGKGTKVNKKNCGEILNILPSEREYVVAIIVFFTEDYADSESEPKPESEKKLVGTLTSALFQFIKNHPKVAVAGGLHHKNIVFKADSFGPVENEPVAFGIVIIGDPTRVRASAVNFPGPTNNADEMKKIHKAKKPVEISSESLNELKNMKKYCEFENGGSFAFQISCADRGLRIHKTLHKEASLFKSIFPNTPLVGGFNGGEFIHEYKPWKLENQQYKIPNEEADLEPFYSTTFVLVSYT